MNHKEKRISELLDEFNKLAQEEHWKKLLPVLSEIITLASDHPDIRVEAYVNRGVAKRNLGYIQGEINDCNRALRINDKYVDAYTNRGVAKEKLGDFQGAIDDFNKALEIDKDANTYFNRGVAEGKLGNIQNEMDDYTKALKIDDKYLPAYINRGIVKIKSDDFQGAIVDYNKVLEIDNKCVNAYAYRGAAKMKLGDFQGAIDDCNKALEIDDKHVDAYNNRGAAKMNLGDFQNALNDFDKALKIDSNNSKAIHNRAATRALMASQKEHEKNIKKINEERERELLDANHYKKERDECKKEFNALNVNKEKSTQTLDTSVKIVVGCLAAFLFFLIFLNDNNSQLKLLAFFPASAIGSLFLFPFIWRIRNINHDRNRYWALGEDMHTKWILTSSAHHRDIQGELREKLILKLFEHHSSSNTTNIILSKHGDGGKSDDINNIIKNFTAPKDNGAQDK